jgi:hypothetical protein
VCTTGVSALVASFELTSGAGVVVLIVVLGLLALAWVVSLFMLIVDQISIGAKILWFVALTCLAPITIPLYLVLRHRRHSVS